ncbi:hypothetical protein SK128_013088 [Halocaridina rubra]|uniref:Uncharacterized protein n=1 Tax=Halocaridina rubra TaxID=373956 RepID=A0AAN9AA06_HALRR
MIFKSIWQPCKTDLQKTRAMADDQSATIRDSQDKQEKLLGENTKLSQQIESYKSLQGENENLKRQIQIVQNSAKLSEDRIHELEAQLKQKREAENNAPPPEVKEIAEAGQDLIQKNLPDSGGANPDSKKHCSRTTGSAKRQKSRLLRQRNPKRKCQ